MQVSFRKSKGTLLHFGKNEDRDTYTLNIETDEGTDSYPMLSEEEISGIIIEDFEQGRTITGEITFR